MCHITVKVSLPHATSTGTVSGVLTLEPVKPKQKPPTSSFAERNAFPQLSEEPLGKWGLTSPRGHSRRCGKRHAKTRGCSGCPGRCGGGREPSHASGPPSQRTWFRGIPLSGCKGPEWLRCPLPRSRAGPVLPLPGCLSGFFEGVPPSPVTCPRALCPFLTWKCSPSP